MVAGWKFHRVWWVGPRRQEGYQRIDLKTHALSTLPGSEGLFSPQMSPDGRYVAAFPTDASKLMLYDLGTGQWQEKDGGIFQFNSWSRDGRWIYLLMLAEFPRLSALTLLAESLSQLSACVMWEQAARDWVGLDESENPMLVLDKSITEVYRLIFKFPEIGRCCIDRLNGQP